MISDGKSVGLVAHALHQLKRRRGARQREHALLGRKNDLLQTLGESANLQVVDAQLGKGLERGVKDAVMIADAIIAELKKGGEK